MPGLAYFFLRVVEKVVLYLKSHSAHHAEIPHFFHRLFVRTYGNGSDGSARRYERGGFSAYDIVINVFGDIQLLCFFYLEQFAFGHFLCRVADNAQHVELFVVYGQC